ncbi:keratin, type I cytoskeletal 13-like [Eublepharis macularius]|uniref:Keratin, type I cytoskeletal 13-like n=1 Tax=Eublepharis macularius TaxID=481883 RepID=A0AA97LAN8_EUBMA|nr:keratin, type I cytoskeletal 13-like [Eublepharis macularius]
MSTSYSFKKRTKCSSSSGGGGDGGGSSGGRLCTGSSGGGRSSSVSSRRCTSSVGSSQGFSSGSYGGGIARCNSGGGICHNISGGFSGGSFGGGFGGGGFGGEDAGLLSGNEKVTMQNLNDRLACYMDKVRSLEAENNQFEHLIKEWYQKHGQSTSPKDYSCYYSEIDKLIDELIYEAMATNKVMLDMDNTKMAIDDFKMKYETECGLRQSVEADLNGLRPLLDKLTLDKSDLEMQFESLQDELIHLKKNHDEIKKSAQSQSAGDVTVEVNSSSGPDLKKQLDEMRCEYEQIIEDNRREVEGWYETKMEEVRQQVNSSCQEIDCSQKELGELRREYQTLEIELQSHLSMLQSLQNNLSDMESRYNMQLQQIVGQIDPVEAELAGIKCEIQQQNQEYQTLLGIKTRLEQEICQYHQLLEEGKHLASCIPHGGGSGGSGGGRSSGGKGAGTGAGGGEGRGGGSCQSSPSSQSICASHRSHSPSPCQPSPTPSQSGSGSCFGHSRKH